jgi:pSer/pThr/pTyr-binding forkhead associated (FHA) protein
MDRTLLHGSTRVDLRGGSLSVLAGEASAPSLHIGPEPRVIGRKPGCHLILQDKKVSAAHCEIVATASGVRVRDLGSTNGTFIGDHRVVETLLYKAATIRCGDVVLEFRPGKVERLAPSTTRAIARAARSS